MKKLVLILTMCIMHFLSYAQEPVFAYDNNQIKSKPQFIEAFNNGNFDNITSHSLQKSYNVSAQNGDKYIVKCFKMQVGKMNRVIGTILKLLIMDKQYIL